MNLRKVWENVDRVAQIIRETDFCQNNKIKIGLGAGICYTHMEIGPCVGCWNLSVGEVRFVNGLRLPK